MLCKKTKIVSFLCVVFICVQVMLASPPVVLFSPKDHPSKTLIAMLDEARSKIHAAVYMITDKHIADALINAKRRGVDVQVVTDRSSIESTSGKGAYLRGNGVQVFEYVPREKAKGFANSQPLMHNKFAIIDNKTWTGSFNWTKSADSRNQENVIILDDPSVCVQYDARFNELKTQYCYAPSPMQSQTPSPQPNQKPKPGAWTRPESQDTGTVFWRMLPEFLQNLFGG